MALIISKTACMRRVHLSLTKRVTKCCSPRKTSFIPHTIKEMFSSSGRLMSTIRQEHSEISCEDNKTGFGDADNKITTFENSRFRELKKRIENLLSFYDLKQGTYKADRSRALEAGYLMCSMREIYQKNRSPNIDIENELKELIDSQEFIKLSSIVDANLHMYTPTLVVSLFQSSAILKLSPECVIVQKLIKLLESNINVFNSLQILYIIRSIAYFNSENEKLNQLKMLCLYTVTNCFEEKLEGNEKLESLIYFAKMSFLPIEIREKLLGLIFASIDKVKSHGILIHLSKIIFFKEFKPYFQCNLYLIKNYFKVLEALVDDTWQPNDIETILIHCRKYGWEYIKYSNEEFWDKVAAIVVNQSYPFSTTMSIAEVMRTIPHFNKGLLKYLYKRALEEELKTKDCSRLAVIFGVFNFRAVEALEWNEFLVKLFRSQDDLSGVHTIYDALNSACLGIHDEKTVDKAVDYMYNNIAHDLGTDSLDRVSVSQWRFLLFHQYVNVYFPTYKRTHAMNCDRILELLRDSVTHFKWRPTILQLAGNENCILTKCSTSLHHFISYVVVLDESGNFTDISEYNVVEGRINVEDIVTKPNHTMILILDFHPRFNFEMKNIDRCIGYLDLYILTLEKMGYNVLYLSSRTFWTLTPVERKHYLEEALRQKLETTNSKNKASEEVPNNLQGAT